jgi:hypothetical protein
MYVGTAGLLVAHATPHRRENVSTVVQEQRVPRTNLDEWTIRRLGGEAVTTGDAPRPRRRA